jgi:hypothetical protein
MQKSLRSSLRLFFRLTPLRPKKNPLQASAMCNDVQGRCRKEQVLPLLLSRLLVRHAKELL